MESVLRLCRKAAASGLIDVLSDGLRLDRADEAGSRRICGCSDAKDLTRRPPATMSSLAGPRSYLRGRGKYSRGAGGNFISVPRKKPGCGGWLYATFCHATARRYVGSCINVRSLYEVGAVVV